MSERIISEQHVELPKRCGVIGALMVGGRVVGQIRCDRAPGHVETWGNPHRAILEWAPEAEPDLDLFDPAERFDAEVPIAPPVEDPGTLAPCPHTTVGVCFRCAVHA